MGIDTHLQPLESGSRRNSLFVVARCHQLFTDGRASTGNGQDTDPAYTLRIHFYGSHNRHARPQVEIFQFLAEYSARWDELSAELASDLVPLLAGLRHRLPSLRRFWIQWDSPDSSVAAQSIDSFQTAPCLVEAGICNEYQHIPILLPGHQLTRYYLNGQWEMHAGMLEFSTNLVEAHILITFDDEPWADPRPAIDLMCLQRLYVSHAEILNHLRASALTDAAIYLSRGEDTIQPFIVRSGCILCLERSLTAYISTDVLPKDPFIMTMTVSWTNDLTSANHHCERCDFPKIHLVQG